MNNISTSPSSFRDVLAFGLEYLCFKKDLVQFEIRLRREEAEKERNGETMVSERLDKRQRVIVKV